MIPIVFSLWRPSDSQIRQYFDHSELMTVTYQHVGNSRTRDTPDGYTTTEYSITLGSGRDVFDAAVAGMKKYVIFDLDWVDYLAEGHLEKDNHVAVRVRKFGIWSLEISKILEVFEEEHGDYTSFGFYYGTTGVHVFEGEEIFRITHDLETDEVVYDIFSFSQPSNVLVKITLPLTRSLQHRFVKDSGLRLQEWVAQRVGNENKNSASSIK